MLMFVRHKVDDTTDEDIVMPLDEDVRQSWCITFTDGEIVPK